MPIVDTPMFLRGQSMAESMDKSMAKSMDTTPQRPSHSKIVSFLNVEVFCVHNLVF